MRRTADRVLVTSIKLLSTCIPIPALFGVLRGETTSVLVLLMFFLLLGAVTLGRLGSTPPREVDVRFARGVGWSGAAAALTAKFLVDGRGGILKGIRVFALMLVAHLALTRDAWRLLSVLRNEPIDRIPRKFAYPILAAIPFVIFRLLMPWNVRSPGMSNESATIGEIRAFISVQATYASANGGYFDE